MDMGKKENYLKVVRNRNMIINNCRALQRTNTIYTIAVLRKLYHNDIQRMQAFCTYIIQVSMIS